MTEVEAIKMFNDLLDVPCEMLIKYDSVINCEQKQALVRLRTAEELAIKALEKQIPKKLKEHTQSQYGCIPVCCVCNGIMDLMQGDLNYCPNCGQKLNWESDEK